MLKVDMPILIFIFATFNWLTLTSELHFVKFHPEVASCLLSRGKWKYAPLGMRLLWKYIRNYFLVYQLNFTLFVISPKLQRIWSWNFGFAIRKIWAFIWYWKIHYFRLSPGDENVIDIRSFNLFSQQQQQTTDNSRQWQTTTVDKVILMCLSC